MAPAGEAVAAARWRGERQILVAEFSPALVRSVAEAHDLHSLELKPQHGARDPQVVHLLFALREGLSNAIQAENAYAEAIGRAIILRLHRAYASSATMRLHRGGLSRASLRRVTEYIHAHLDCDLGLRNLAAVSGLSADHFARAFRESTGVPPHRYVLQRRLAHARRLLETSEMPIVEIASSLGFAEPRANAG